MSRRVYTLVEGARFELYTLLQNVLTVSDCSKFAAYNDGWDDKAVTKKLIADSKFIKPADGLDPDVYAAILRKTADVRVKNFGTFEDRAKATETRKSRYYGGGNLSEELNEVRTNNKLALDEMDVRFQVLQVTVKRTNQRISDLTSDVRTLANHLRCLCDELGSAQMAQLETEPTLVDKRDAGS